MIEKVKALIVSCVAPSHELGDDEDLLMSGVLDSISAMKLVANIEEELSLKIPAVDVTFENFQSAQAIADYLQARLT